MSSSAATEKPAWLAGYEGNPTKVKTPYGTGLGLYQLRLVPVETQVLELVKQLKDKGVFFVNQSTLLMREIDISTYMPPFDVLVMKDIIYGFAGFRVVQYERASSEKNLAEDVQTMQTSVSD